MGGYLQNLVDADINTVQELAHLLSADRRVCVHILTGGGKDVLPKRWQVDGLVYGCKDFLNANVGQ